VKYKVELGSFCTRLITRKITVNAKDEREAGQKAIDKFIELEQKVSSSVDFGEPHIDFVDVVDS
jgi:hypothetical protein